MTQSLQKDMFRTHDQDDLSTLDDFEYVSSCSEDSLSDFEEDISMQAIVQLVKKDSMRKTKTPRSSFASRSSTSPKDPHTNVPNSPPSTERMPWNFSISSKGSSCSSASQKFKEERRGSMKMSFDMLRMYTKLDVISADEIRYLLILSKILMFIAFCFTTFYVYVSKTGYLKKSVFIFQPEEAGSMLLTTGFASKVIYRTSFVNLWISVVLNLLLLALSLIVTTCFIIRVLQVDAKFRTQSQVWIIYGLISLNLYLLPVPGNYFGVLYRMENTEDDEALFLTLIGQTITQSSFIAGVMLYLWFSSHSYRCLDTVPLMFYPPKLIMLSIHYALRDLLAGTTNQYREYVPFMTLLTVLWSKAPLNNIAICVLITITLFDLIFVFCIWNSFRKTNRVLKKLEYLPHRHRHIGFLFLKSNSLMFIVTYYTARLVQYLIPNSSTMQVMHSATSEQFDSGFEFLQNNETPVAWIYFVYMFIEAYLKLPADADGFFSGSSVDGLSTSYLFPPASERRLYRRKEKRKGEGSNVKLFVLETHILMFNFSWYIYYHGTKKQHKANLGYDLLEYNITHYIKDKVTDTHAIIAENGKRIILAFRGTSSLKNVKTDIHATFTRFVKIIPTILDEGKVTKDWYDARIHAGFAKAYQSIADELISALKQTWEENPRTVYITGHSLGGALATLCAIDVNLSLGIGQEHIVVSTFGQPRVGNSVFAEAYNQRIKTHMRVCISSDLITKIPSIGYKHVGEKVLLTTGGFMFIDPNDFETYFWQRDAANMVYHRKSSYMLALRSWCVIRHGMKYRPKFWRWPVKRHEMQLFDHVLSQPKEMSGLFSWSSSGKGESVDSDESDQFSVFSAASRNTLIDLLEQDRRGGREAGYDACMMWGRLARKLLEKDNSK